MINTIILIASVFVGSILGFFFNEKQNFSKKLLIFSAGFLISVTLLEIFPSIYSQNNHAIGSWVIAGVVVQIFLEYATRGIEHGHVHHHTQNSTIPFGLIFGLCIHAFLEGMPIANHQETHAHLVTAIAIHNIPIALVLSSLLFNSSLQKWKSILLLIIFALATPFGSVLANCIDLSIFQPKILAIVGGIFLHISSVIIFESNANHKLNWEKLFIVLLGIIVGYGLVH